MIGATVLEDLGFKRSSGTSSGSADINASSALISDFTIVDFRYLVVLLQRTHIVVFDCHQVLEGSARQARYINKVQLRTPGASGEESFGSGTPVFTRLECIETQCGVDRDATAKVRYQQHAPEDSRRLLAIGKQASQLLLLEFPAATSSEEDMMDAPE